MTAPSHPHAALVRYDAMVSAIAECERVDEAKAAWIAAARRDFHPGPREACAICGRHRSISHAHHLRPLARQFAGPETIPDQRAVWLCPNHHSAVHLLLSQAHGSRVPASREVIMLIGELTEEGTLAAVLGLVSGESEALRKSASARLAHADALEAEGLERGAA